MNDVNQLLREYATNSSEAAFRELVTRYVDLVYSAALRRMRGDTHRAEEVTQTVFTDLARKAETLPERVMLGGWLHRHTGFVASNLVRGEIRRQAREKEAAAMMLNESEETSWQEMAPYLDEAIDQLEAADREAILLRFFERRDLKSLGAVFGVSEDAAQKRVSRAVDKLRVMLAERGVTIAAAGLGVMLLEQSVSAGPAGLAVSVGSKALQEAVLSGASGGATGLTFWGVLKPMLVLLVLAAVVGGLMWRQTASQAVTANQRTSSADTPEKAKPVNQSNAVASVAKVEIAMGEGSADFLRLKLVSAETGEPVTGAMIMVERTDGKKVTKAELMVNEAGEVDLAINKAALTSLELKTVRDGFGGKRLQWSSELGDVLPEAYTVKLERAVTIGGRVLDADGQPVKEASVGFYHRSNPQLKRVMETHGFDYYEVKTDAEGLWRTDRIAQETLLEIDVRAEHDLWIKSGSEIVALKTGMEEQLRQGTYVIHLGRPMTVRGVVVDPEGKPVAGAEVFAGIKGFSRKVTTDTEGQFVLGGCPLGGNLLTAEAKGYATVTEEIVVREVANSIRLKLQEGKSFILRVLDTEGKPVTNANVWLDYMNSGGPGLHPIQVEFDKKTDAEGRVLWQGAPDRELKFLVSAPKFMESWVVVRPDDNEHGVTMKPALVIEGTVKDAKTGEPVPEFRILTGSPLKSAGNEGNRIEWSTMERFWLHFSGGKFKRSLEEAVSGDDANPGYFFRFEATGYVPHVTGFVSPDAGVVRLEVALKPARSHAVMVKLPDGRPAGDVEVGLVSATSNLRIGPMGFGFDPDYSAILRADKAGIFKVSVDETIQRIVVTHPSGYGEETMASLLDNPTLQIRPWGKVEGIAYQDGHPVSRVLVVLDFKDGKQNGLSLYNMPYLMRTDKQGRFAFDQVPFGQLTARLTLSNGVPAKRYYVTQELVVRPGETTQVKVGEEESTTLP